MTVLKYYYLVEFTPQVESKFPGLNLTKDFPGLTQAVAGSDEFNTYEACTNHAVDFLKTKIDILNSEENKYKIFFEKNQFDKTLPAAGEWEANEVVKIYIADSKQSVYNSIFKVRVCFINSVDALSFYMEAPSTLQ